MFCNSAAGAARRDCATRVRNGVCLEREQPPGMRSRQLLGKGESLTGLGPAELGVPSPHTGALLKCFRVQSEGVTAVNQLFLCVTFLKSKVLHAETHKAANFLPPQKPFTEKPLDCRQRCVLDVLKPYPWRAAATQLLYLKKLQENIRGLFLASKVRFFPPAQPGQQRSPVCASSGKGSLHEVML